LRAPQKPGKNERFANLAPCCADHCAIIQQ
jgi:hypothetical protein